MRKDKPILTVTLNPSVDKVSFVNKFKIGETHNKVREIHLAGGKGINVSRTLNSLRVNNMATGFLGGCTGEMIRQALKNEKISNRFIQMKSSNRVNQTIVDRVEGRQTRIIEEGGSISLLELKRFKVQYKNLLSQSKCVVISGANIRGFPIEQICQMIRLAKEAEIPVFVDSRPNILKRILPCRPDGIFPNLEEFSNALDLNPKTLESISKAIIGSHFKKIPYVFVTLGKDGAICYDGKKMLYAKAPKQRLISDVGCGDSFLAAAVSSILAGKTLEENLIDGIAAGAANAVQIFPGKISLKEYREMRNKVRVKVL